MINLSELYQKLIKIVGEKLGWRRPSVNEVYKISFEKPEFTENVLARLPVYSREIVKKQGNNIYLRKLLKEC